MDEARRIKQLLYPLSRDIRNLHIFTQNIERALQAPPSRFAVAAPVSLITAKQTVKSLLTSVRTLMEVNEIILKESAIAENLSQHSMTLVLRPAAHLNDVAREKKVYLERAHGLLARLNVYLNPLFIFTMANLPVVDALKNHTMATEQRLALVKKSISRLSDQEMITGISSVLEARLQKLYPSLSTIRQECSDIAQQIALIMGKMNRLTDYSGQLEPAVRMALAVDSALFAFKPEMKLLKQLGKAFHRIQQQNDSKALLNEHVHVAFAGLELPMDALFQIETQLKKLMDHTLEPMLMPLTDMVERIKDNPLQTHELKGLELTLATQQARFAHVEKMLMSVVDDLSQVAATAKQSIPAA